MRGTFRRYLAVLTLTCLVLLLPGLLNIVLVFNSGELMAYTDIARSQQGSGAIWGSAFNGNHYRYKLEVVRSRKPDVVALGSSRVMQFREESFTESFANAGGAMRTLEEGELFLDDMLASHTPRVLLLGLDFWWFNDSRPIQTEYPEHEEGSTALTRHKVTSPFSWLVDGKLRPRQYLSLLFRDRRDTRYGHESLGIKAVISGDGFRRDGSYFQGNLYLENEPPNPGFSDILERTHSGTNGFEPGQTVGDRVQVLQRIVEKAEARGIKVVMFATPVAPPVLEAVLDRRMDYAYIPEMQRQLREMGVEYYDFLSKSPWNSDPCEYLDGIHGGDVAYQRMLLAITEMNPGSAIAPYIQRPRIERIVQAFAGRTVSWLDGASAPIAETDFVGLGCAKGPVLIQE